MSRQQLRIAGLLVVGLLTACSSTMPQSAVAPDTPPLAVTEAPRTSATPTTAPTPSDGPVTASMAKLALDGERYATLGDPNAPLTVIEFSDYG